MEEDLDLMRTSQDIGKDFEKMLEGIFSTLTQTHSFKMHKFVDSHAAGNTVAAQPADYLLASHKGLFYCEAKASTKNKNFQRSMLQPSQRGAILHYGVGLGVPYFILFHHKPYVYCLDAAKAMKGARAKLEYSTLFRCTEDQLKSELIKLWQLVGSKTMIERIQNHDE